MIDLFHVFHAAIVLVFPRPYEVMYQIEGCNSIHWWFLKMSILVITYIAYEENTLGHAVTIYGPQL